MKVFIKKAVSVLLIAMVLVGSAPLTGLADIDFGEIFSVKAEAATSGTCGENLTWTFDELTGTLAITGTGETYDWSSSSSVPWDSLRSKIKKVTISYGITNIDSMAFHYCPALTSIIVDSTNTAYSNDNFGVLFNKDKTELINYPIGNTRTSYDIPNSVKIIDRNAFEYCTNLTNISIPDSVTFILSYPFRGCTSLTSIMVDSENTAYSSDEIGVLFNKDKTQLIQYPNESTKTNYDIPNSVTSISGYAFYACDNLTSVTIPDSVTNIGAGAFLNCNKLADVYYTGTEEEWNAITISERNDPLLNATIHFNYVPGEVTASGKCGDNLYWEFQESTGNLIISGTGDMYDFIHRGEFDYSTPWYSYHYDINRVIIENGASSIGDYAFIHCVYAEEINIPDTITRIGEYAFWCCYALNSIYLHKNIEFIGDRAFAVCRENEAFIVDNENLNYSSDESGVLYNKNKSVLINYPLKNSRTHFDIPDSVTHIEDNAFDSSKNIETVNIPDSVVFIGDSAFSSCHKLKSLTIPENVTTINLGTFSFCYDLETITIPDGVTVIYGSAFSGCSSLKTVTLPKGIKYIKEHSFRDCTSLEYINIPSNVETIDEEAFMNCSSLKYAHIPGSVTEIEEDAFNNTSAYICSTRYDVYAKEYADEMGIEFRLCGGHGEYPYEYIATWNVDGVETDTFYEYGETIVAPEITTEKIGYSFEGWSPAVPATMPSRDMYFTAIWTPVQYTITFNTDGGNVIPAITQNYNTPVTAPAHPTKQGYVFAGWDKEIPATMPAENITVTAVWKCANDTPYCIETYMMDITGKYVKTTEFKIGITNNVTTIIPEEPEGFTFNAEKSVLSGIIAADGSLVLKVYYDRNKTTIEINGKTEDYYYGEEISKPENPTPPKGYEQDGWIDGEGNKVEFPLIADENTPTVIKPNFVKKSYTVIWNVDGVETKETYKYGDKIVKPVDPAKQGYVFAGWTPSVPETQGASDTTYTAVWANATDVKFIVESYVMNTKGAYDMSTETYYGTTGEEIVLEPEVSEEFTLNEEKSVLSGKVAADGSLVLKVYYDRNKIIIEINGKTEDYYYGEEISKPENPTPPKGYEQDGWIDGEGNKVEFPLIADENTPTVIKPNFVKKSYTVKWIVDGTETKTTCKYGDKIVKPSNPVKAGYKFMGWTPSVPANMPAYDLTFTAVFEKSYICPDCDKEIVGEDEINKHIESETKVNINNGSAIGELKPGATITIKAGQIDGKIFSHWVVEGAAIEDAYSPETKVTLGTGKITITAEYDDCECKCHKGGITAFFFKIVVFFQKLFGKNVECPCGAKH